MKISLLTLPIAGLVALSAIGLAGAAPPADAPNDNGNAASSGNCVAIYSAQWRANGLHSGQTLGVGNNEDGADNTSHGQRGAELKALQASCGAQAE